MNFSFNSSTANLLNPKVRRQKFGIGSLILLSVLGVAFMGASWFIIQGNKIDPTWTRVDGTVTGASTSVSSSSDGGTNYAAIVSYVVDGTTYRVTSRDSSSAYPNNGSHKQVAYNPSQPQQAKVVLSTGTNLILLIFPAVGLAMLLLGPIMFIRSMRRNADIGNLTTSGIKLQGILTNIQTPTFGNNNSNNYKLEVAATDGNGNVQTYVSDSLTGIGGLAMADYHTNPIPIDVYINPSNPQDYYVDVSDVPNLTPERIADLIKAATSRQQSPAGPLATPGQPQALNSAVQPVPPATSQLPTPPLPPSQPSA